MKQLLPFIAFLALVGCASTPTSDLPIRSDGRASFGESTRVGSIVVTPQSVVEDSRCPINARCVWAGRLVLSTRIDGPGWRESIKLTLGQPYITHGAAVVLVSAEPGKLAGATPSAPANLFGFEQR
jgi:hypothetical protein